MPAHVAFCKAMDGVKPIAAAQPTASQLVADAATSTAVASAGDVAVVTATSDVYVAFAETPGTPSATNGHRIASGQTRDFGYLQAGWKMAVAAV